MSRNDPLSATANPLQQRLAPLRTWWRGVPLREQRLVWIGSSVLALGLLWMLALAPAVQTLRNAPRELDAVDAQMEAMQSMAAEATELRAAPPLSRQQAIAALQAATDRLGDAGKLSLQGDRAVLTLTKASTAALRDWLAEARSGARARPLEATLTRGPDGTSGTLVVAPGGGG